MADGKNELAREAIMKSRDRLGMLSERERAAMLRTFVELIPQIPPGCSPAVDRELGELRRARKAVGRRTRFNQQ